MNEGDRRGQVENSVDVSMRFMEKKDAFAVAELTEQLGYRRTAEEVEEWVGSMDREGDRVAFVACVERVVVGWIEVSTERHLHVPAFGLIGGLVVRDGVRGMGVGRLLCERAEQ